MLARLGQQLVAALFDPVVRWLDAHADSIVHVLLHRVTRCLAAWLVALLAAGFSGHQAWHAFDTYDGDEGPRADSNGGHCTIDFGGQWLMGAMLVQGHGGDLYNRKVQRAVLQVAYPIENQAPRAKANGAANWLLCLLGTDDRARRPTGALAAPFAAADPWQAATLTAAAHPWWTQRDLAELHYPIGGPLYPPINSLVYAPLGLLAPTTAYRVNQLLNLAWAFLGGLGIWYLTRGSIWIPLAALLIIVYPGFKGSIQLGQNATLTLMILIWGWALLARGHPVAAGVVWGLLAFKPVWAAAFFLVPLLTGRWRTCLAMGLTGAILALVTLPFVGWRPWLDWLWVGQEASELYKVDQNWVFLSRDLLGIPRRWLLDFSLPSQHRDVPAAALAGWGLFGACLGGTFLLAWLRPRQATATIGIPAGFLLLGAWLACFHFMYYDVLLTALPLVVLLAEPKKLLEPLCVAVLPLAAQPGPVPFPTYYGPWPADEEPPQLPAQQPLPGQVWVLNRMVPNVLLALLLIEHGFGHIGLNGTAIWWPRPLEITTTHDGNKHALVGVQPRTGPLTTARDSAGNVVLNLPLRDRVALQDEDGEGFVYRQVGQPATLRLTTSLYDDGQPWDTFCLLFLWGWCGFLWLLQPPPQQTAARSAGSNHPAQFIEFAPDVGGGHEGFPDEHGPDPGRLEP